MPSAVRVSNSTRANLGAVLLALRSLLCACLVAVELAVDARVLMRWNRFPLSTRAGHLVSGSRRVSERVATMASKISASAPSERIRLPVAGGGRARRRTGGSRRGRARREDAQSGTAVRGSFGVIVQAVVSSWSGPLPLWPRPFAAFKAIQKPEADEARTQRRSLQGRSMERRTASTAFLSREEWRRYSSAARGRKSPAAVAGLIRFWGDRSS